MKLDDYKNEYGEWAQTGMVVGKKYHTIGGRYWSNMTQRCKDNSAAQRQSPAYVGCSYTWTSCHEFIEWARKQVGYGNGQLDKDILLKGNKVYCPVLCVFVPRAVNSLLIKRDADRGEWPVGVSWNKNREKFQAMLSVKGKNKFLGFFTTPEEAFATYKPAKEDEIKRVAALHQSVLDPRVYDALMSYTVEIAD